jgi:hypothetical protein
VSTIKNLIQHNRLVNGTWLGLSLNGNQVVRRVCVSSSTANQLCAIDYSTNTEIIVNPLSVIEIDGMTVSRWLAQADLDSSGQKLLSGKKRGRRIKQIKT